MSDQSISPLKGQDFDPYRGQCRRIDLQFRGEYPHLETRIYRIDNYQYQICITCAANDFADIKKHFDESIRFVGVPVMLVDCAPAKFMEIISPIDDKHIASKYEGVPFTIADLQDYLECAHPPLLISTIKEDHHEHTIAVVVEGAHDQSVLDSIRDSLHHVCLPYRSIVTDGGKPAPLQRSQSDITVITRQRSLGGPITKCLDKDESLWFENVDKMYQGDFTKESLQFINPSESSCIVNYSLFDNVDIRNLILLYDTIYCLLPLSEDMPAFFEQQKLSRSELLHLVSRGRLRFVNVQPEARLDCRLLNEALEIDEGSVITRRALSSLLVMDFVELARSYILCDSQLRDNAIASIDGLPGVPGASKRDMARIMLWPLSALRSGFTPISRSGPMGIMDIGVNEAITGLFPIAERGKYRFDFTVNSPAVHIAHALDATYFPFLDSKSGYTDHPFSSMMGRILNLYRYLSFDQIMEAKDMDRSADAGSPSIALMQIFRPNDYIPIEEFEAGIARSAGRREMRSLFSELSGMDGSDRVARIERYNREVKERLERRANYSVYLDLGADVADILLSQATLISPLTILKWLIRGGKTIKDKIPYFKWVEDCVAEYAMPRDPHKRRVKLLSSINRIASLRGPCGNS